MIIIELTGGLGNQLFQLCFALALTEKTNEPIGIHKLYVSTSPHDSSIDRVINFRNLPLQVVEPKFYDKRIVTENIDEIFNSKRRWANLVVKGYFQDARELKNSMNILKNSLDKNLLAMRSVSSKELGKNDLVFHYRGGDYITNLAHAKKVGVLDHRYYLNALNYARRNDFDKPNVFVITDDVYHANRCFEKIGVEFSFVETNGWLQDFLLLSICKYSIISNSTFSWWARMLLSDEDSLTIIPDPWGKDLPSSFNFNFDERVILVPSYLN